MRTAKDSGMGKEDAEWTAEGGGSGLKRTGRIDP